MRKFKLKITPISKQSKKEKRKLLVLAVVLIIGFMAGTILVWGASQRPYYRPEFLSRSVSEGR